MTSTATRSRKPATTSNSTGNSNKAIKSTTSVKTTSLAVRSLASSKPGKHGSSQPVGRPKAGGAQAQRDIPKATLKEMKDLHALGISMTNIHRIVQKKLKKTSPNVSYYDVWKALRTA